MARTTVDKVRKVIETEPSVDITRFITTANSVTNYLVTRDSANSIPSDLLIEIETYLAAHFYALYDRAVQSESRGGASATYQGQTSQGLESTTWGQQAVALDITGNLSSFGKGRPKLFWLGKQVANKEDFWDRN